ncbi:MAG: hypothetical protein DWQ02_27275 [Bacteroidetes bacterium]|nr:MAG: hypothetical protein DWQ02_27275 [Bacteroidota bacterium]
MKKIKILIMAAVMIQLTACDLGKEPEIGGVALQEMCGEWWIRVSLDETPLTGYYLMSTFNTAANTDSDLFIDDHELWPFKVSATADLGSMSMSGSNLDNLYDEAITVNIIEGKIIEDAATTSGGNKADSIYLRLEFADDPGNEYVYSGYKRTGFLEDEH